MNLDQEIFDRACALLSASSTPDNTLLREVCALSQAEFTRRLIDKVTVSDILELFIRGCALLAVSFYVQFNNSFDDFSSVSVGNVSVSKGSSGSSNCNAAELRLQAENLLRPYLIDNGFSFKGVRG